MKNSDKFDKTSDFLDLMSRSERKAWERSQKEKATGEKKSEEKSEKTSRQEKYKLNQEEKEVKTILKDKKPLEPIKEEQMENTQSIKSVEEEELEVGELGKTQHFLNMTSEITSILSENVEENLFEEKKKPSKFNPITWIGLLIILCFGFFTYLVISSGYDEELLLLIDSGFLLGIIFFFGISIVSNRKWMKVFSVFNFLVILAYAGTNAFLLYDFETNKKEKEEPTPVKEETKEYSLNCSSDTISFDIQSKDNNIIRIEKKETFTTDEELNEITKIFENQEGIETKLEDKNLTVIFDFEKLDVNQYKVVMRNYLEYYRSSSDFTYVEEDKLLYDIFKESELQDFKCTEKEGLQ